ncbi:Acetate CoA-transferase YdiF [compost metagenome]
MITKVGLGTFVDPRHGGGKLNEVTYEDLVEVLTLDGQEYLRFKPFKVDYALMLASEADDRGNLTTRREPADLDIYAVALAAHNSGGQVIAQVKRKPTEPIPGRQVRVPGIMVDTVVEVAHQRQCAISEYDPTLSGEARSEILDQPLSDDPMRLIVGRRAAREMGINQSVNFGFGYPGVIPALLASQGRGDDYWGSVEQGVHKADMLDGVMFGAARNANAMLGSVDQFDFYSGGGIDLTFLGMGELDAQGNVNVSKLGTRVVGPGGFMDITQGARKIVFCGAFEAKGLDVVEGGAGIEIRSPGSVPKLVNQVRHITFSGHQALKDGKQVIYITERAVFQLTEQGVVLIEVAEGVDLQRDVLQRMEFTPLLAPALEQQRSSGKHVASAL